MKTYYKVTDTFDRSCIQTGRPLMTQYVKDKYVTNGQSRETFRLKEEPYAYLL